MKRLVITSLATICFLMSIQANAQIFLSIDGVDGESNFAAFKNSTQLSSFSWGAKNSATINATGLSAGKTAIEEFSFTKTRGISSAALQSWVYNGKRIPKAEIRYYPAGNNTPVLTIILEDVSITSWNISSTENEKPVETFTMSASRYKTEEFARNPDGSPKRIATGWDGSRNVPITW